MYASSHHGVTKDLVVQLPCQSPLIRAFPTGADAHTTQGPVLKFLPLRKRRSLCKTFWWESRCTVPRPDRDACKAAANANASAASYPLAGYTYQHNVSGLGDFASHCYAIEHTASNFEWDPQPQANVDSARGPGYYDGVPYDCANAAVDPNDRNHFLFSKGGQYRAWESTDGGKTLTLHDFKGKGAGEVVGLSMAPDGKTGFATTISAFASASNSASAVWHFQA